VFWGARISLEERMLFQDLAYLAYVAYAEKVRWRFCCPSFY
jgi:hypothetical protein